MRRRRSRTPDPWEAAGFAPAPGSERSRLARLLPESLTSTTRRAVWRRARARRVLAALVAGAAAWVVVSAFLPAPVETGLPVVVARRDLASATPLSTADLAVERRPRSTVPAEAVTSPDDLVGAVLAGRVTRGEVLTAARVLGPGQLGGEDGTGGDGSEGAVAGRRVALSVPLADDGLLASLRPGDRVRVLAPGSGDALATSAPVLTVVGSGAGVLGQGAASGAVVLALRDAEASAVAAAMGGPAGPSGFVLALEPG